MKRRSFPWMQENSADRAMSFDTGRVASGNSGNWITLAVDNGSGAGIGSGGASAMALPRRAMEARSSGSLTVANNDRSSWASIDCLYADGYCAHGINLLYLST